MIDPFVQAMFKRSKHNKVIYFYNQPRLLWTTKTNYPHKWNIYHIFKPNKFKDVQNLYQDKASMDMSLNEFKYITCTCWNENYQPLTIDMTEDEYTRRYRLGLNSIFVPESSPF